MSSTKQKHWEIKDNPVLLQKHLNPCSSWTMLCGAIPRPLPHNPFLAGWQTLGSQPEDGGTTGLSDPRAWGGAGAALLEPWAVLTFAGLLGNP